VADGADGHKVVTFLYTLTPGECPKSYGLNVARLARLPASVIDRAKAKSEEFEAAVLTAEVDSLLRTPPPAAMAVDEEGGEAAPQPAVLSEDEKAVALFRLAKRLFGAGAQQAAAGGGDGDEQHHGVALPPGQLESAAVQLLRAARALAPEPAAA
jgi:hypothetical protein